MTPLAGLAGDGPPIAEAVSARRRAASVFAVLAAMTLVVLDAGIVNVALPAMAGSLAVAPTQAILLVTAYQAGLVTALLPAGALGERFGHRRVFTVGVLVFAVASAGCAASGSLVWLIAARLVQGLGGAAIMALGVALLRSAVSDDRLGAAIGWNALTVALASAAAPSLGAAILTVAPWQALFGINLPVAALVLAASRALPCSRPRGLPTDGFSILLNAVAFGGLIVAAELALAMPLLAVGLLIAAASAFALLVRREAAKAAPLVPLDLLGSEPFRLSVIASILCFTAQSMGLLALPFLLQHDLGLSALQAGAYITLWPLGVAGASVVANRLSHRISSAWLCGIGAGLLASGLCGAAVWRLHDAPAGLAPLLALCGLGFGLFQSPNNRNLFMSAPAGRSGAAGGMQGTARVSGQTLGSVAIALLFSTPIAAPTMGLAIASVFAVLAAVASLFRILA